MEQEFAYYVSHIVKPSRGSVTKNNGTIVNNFFIQIIALKSGERKSVCWIENGEKRFFNCKDLEEVKKIVKSILSHYSKFKFEILIFDKGYESELSVAIVSSFVNGEDVQERINAYNLKKNLE